MNLDNYFSGATTTGYFGGMFPFQAGGATGDATGDIDATLPACVGQAVGSVLFRQGVGTLAGARILTALPVSKARQIRFSGAVAAEARATEGDLAGVYRRYHNSRVAGEMKPGGVVITGLINASFLDEEEATLVL